MNITLFMAISIDSYIARENGEEDFLSNENWRTFIALAQERGSFIYGRRTYEAVQAWGHEYTEDLKAIPYRVCVSQKLSGKRENGFVFVSSPQEAINFLSYHNCQQAVLSGGSINNTAFAKSGFIDEIIFNINPIVLGRGIPIFSSRHQDLEMELELLSVNMLKSGIVQTRYRVLKQQKNCISDEG